MMKKRTRKKENLNEKSGNIGLAWKEASRVTKEVMDLANKNAILNPCPPFYRGEEVSEDVIQSEYFVGYEFKKNLLVVQQAIMIWCMLAQGK